MFWMQCFDYYSHYNDGKVYVSWDWSSLMAIMAALQFLYYALHALRSLNVDLWYFTFEACLYVVLNEVNVFSKQWRSQDFCLEGTVLYA